MDANERRMREIWLVEDAFNIPSYERLSRRDVAAKNYVGPIGQGKAMKDAVSPSIIEEFLVTCAALARAAIGECYRSSSASYVEGMLSHAELVLLSGDGQKIIRRALLELGESDRILMLRRMQECVLAQEVNGAGLFATLSKARGMVKELTNHCGRVDGCAWHQLQTLALVLSLGQTDDHDLMSRVPDTRSVRPEKALAAAGASAELASVGVESDEV